MTKTVVVVAFAERWLRPGRRARPCALRGSDWIDEWQLGPPEWLGLNLGAASGEVGRLSRSPWAATVLSTGLAHRSLQICTLRDVRSRWVPIVLAGWLPCREWV